MEPLTKSVVIQRPIEEVFELTTCLVRCAVWQTLIVETEKETPGPVGVGTRYKHKAKYLGVTMETHPVITVWEPPYRMEYESMTSAATYHAAYVFEPEGDATRFTATLSADTSGIVLRVTEPFMRASLMRQFESDLEVLMHLLEEGIPVPLPPDERM